MFVCFLSGGCALQDIIMPFLRKVYIKENEDNFNKIYYTSTLI